MFLKCVLKEKMTVKQALACEFSMSKNLILKLKLSNNIFLNNIPVPINTVSNINDVLTVNLNYEEDNSNIVPVYIPLNILYEDEYFLIIDKEPNIPIHPSFSHYNFTLSNGIKFYFDSIRIK